MLEEPMKGRQAEASGGRETPPRHSLSLAQALQLQHASACKGRQKVFVFLELGSDAN